MKLVIKDDYSSRDEDLSSRLKKDSFQLGVNSESYKIS